jgi:hypothetical protein
MIDTPCINVRPTPNPLQVFLADSSHITSTHEAKLDLPMLPRLACQAHLLPALQPNALLSIGQLCDHGCTAEFTSTAVIISKHNNTPVLQGYRDPIGLWRILMQHKPTTQQPAHTIPTTVVPCPGSAHQHTANSTIDTRTQHELIQYLHATCFSPNESTWIQAIKNNHFTTWPLLTETAVLKYF